MTMQEKIALASAVIAVISVITNIVLSIMLYRLKKRDEEEAARRRKLDEEEAARHEQRKEELASLVGYLHPCLASLNEPPSSTSGQWTRYGNMVARR